MATEQLAASNLSVGFTKNPIINGVNVEISGGEILAVAGPNGAGKSTLVKALARQLKPMGGTVTLGGTDIWALTPAEFAAKVAYVPQALEPGHDLTVEEVVMLGRNPHQSWWRWYATGADKNAVESALVATNMLAHRKHYMSELSGGERQRACMATALAQQPQYMILDEPTSHLDFGHQLDLLAQMKQLKSANIACIIVLHDLNLISRIADRVLLLKAEELKPSYVVSLGPTESVLTKPLLAEVFKVDVQTIVDQESGQTLFNPTQRCAN